MVNGTRERSCSNAPLGVKCSSSVYSRSLFLEECHDQDLLPCRGQCSQEKENNRRRKTGKVSHSQETNLQRERQDKRMSDQNPLNFVWGLCSPFPYSPCWHEDQNSEDSSASSQGISTKFSQSPIIRHVNRIPTSRGVPASIYVIGNCE